MVLLVVLLLLLLLLEPFPLDPLPLALLLLSDMDDIFMDMALLDVSESPLLERVDDIMVEPLCFFML